jgi:hypothetical protein
MVDRAQPRVVNRTLLVGSQSPVTLLNVIGVVTKFEVAGDSAWAEIQMIHNTSQESLEVLHPDGFFLGL